MPYNHTATGSPNERELTPEEYRQLNREIQEKKMTNSSVEEMIAQARTWPRDGFGEGRWFHAMADEIERLLGYWTGSKLTGGHDVCHTCQAHCVVIDDKEAEITQLRGNLSLAEEGLASATQEIAQLKACWSEALANVAARNQEIERLKDMIATREEALRALTRELPPLPAHEPLQQQSGVDFDKDLARLDGIRSTMADMRRYSLQGVPQGEVEFLLSFIDNLWREYSRLSNSDSGAPRREAGAGPWNPTTSSDVSIHTQTSQKSECAHVWLDVQKDSMRAYQQCSECGDTREPR